MANTNAVAAPEVSFRDVMNTVFNATIALFNIAPKTISVFTTNLDTVQKFSNAGNLLATRVEARANFDHEIEMVKLTAKLAAKKAAVLAEA